MTIVLPPLKEPLPDDPVELAKQRLLEIMQYSGKNKAPAIAAAEEVLNRIIGKAKNREQPVVYRTTLPPCITSKNEPFVFEIGEDVE